MTPELAAILLSWAVTLSGYPMPAVPPQVVPVPHAFFVAHACGGHECKVWGWYAGGRKVYVDERMDPQTVLGSSIVVHEMVHYLQAVHRGDDRLAAGVAFGTPPSCEQAVAWEYEAYAAQKRFILAYGVYLPVGISMLNVTCDVHEDGP